MSDKYFTFENFRYGLDARKSALTEVPGTLLSIVNAFVNSGGECEQRKSFAKNATAFPSKVFGLQDTDTGLMVFGDVAPNTVGQTFPLPTGVVYQQLYQSPIAIATTMDGVLYSCNFLGKAFVVTHYVDGEVVAWYNGVPVWDSVNGIVKSGFTSAASQAGALADMVDRLANGWLAHAGVTASGPSGPSGYGETALDSSTLIMSPGGVHFSPVEAVVTASSGQMGAQLIDQNYGGVPSQSAKVAFTLNAGTNGTVTVTAPATSAGTGTAALTNGAINFNTSLTQTAADVVAAINNYTFVTGYTAVQNGTTITVFAPSAWGNVTFNLTVTTTGDITTVGGTPSNLFTITINPVGLDVLLASNSGKAVSGSITAAISGATGATGVTFSWDETNADGSAVTNPSGIQISPLAHGSVGPPLRSAATATFTAFLMPNRRVQGYFKCTATDNGAGAQTNQPVVYFTVTLELDGLL